MSELVRSGRGVGRRMEWTAIGFTVALASTLFGAFLFFVFHASGSFLPHSVDWLVR